MLGLKLNHVSKRGHGRDRDDKAEILQWQLQWALPLPVMVMMMTTMNGIWKTRIWFIRSNKYIIDQVLQIIIINKGIGFVYMINILRGLIYRCSVFTIDYLWLTSPHKMFREPQHPWPADICEKLKLWYETCKNWLSMAILYSDLLHGFEHHPSKFQVDMWNL